MLGLLLAPGWGLQVCRKAGGSAGQPHAGPAGISGRPGRRDYARAGRCTGDSRYRPGRSVAVFFFRVDPRRVVVQRLLAGLEGLLRLGAAGRAERGPRPHPGEPGPQLDQIDLVLLELGVGEVVGHVLLLHLAQEVLAAVDDLLVLVVPGGLERRPHFLRARQDAAGQQRRRALHVEDLAAQLAQRPLVAHADGQRGGGVLQVDGPQALEPAPHRRPEAAGLGRDPVDEDQPALVRHAVGVSHAVIVAEVDARPVLTSHAVSAALANTVLANTVLANAVRPKAAPFDAVPSPTATLEVP